jgi:hypothetical protein
MSCHHAPLKLLREYRARKAEQVIVVEAARERVDRSGGVSVEPL